MPQTRLKKKSRAQLREQIASKEGLEEIKGICEEEGILLTDAYNYIAPKETKTSEAVEKTDTVDEILANDGLRVFSEDDKPANPLSDFKKTYQKDCFWEKCAKAYNDPFKKSNLLGGRKSFAGLHAPGSPGNPYSTATVTESPVEPEVPIAGLTNKIDYISTSNVEIPTIKNTVSTAAAQMVSNPPGSDTRHVTIMVGDLKVRLERVGVGLLWEDGFEDSELSGPAIARFAAKTAANDLDVLGRAGIKLIVDNVSATAAFTVPGTGWTYRLARDAETLRRNDYLLNAIVGERTNVLDLDAARATAFGGNLRPDPDAALSNVSGRIQTLNFTTDTAGTGVSTTALYAYNLSETLGLVFRGQEIVITRDYELPQKDMMVRYFRRYGAMYLQPDAPHAQITVP